MVKKTVAKTKFSQLNNKRFYFLDGVVSLPFGLKKFLKIDDFKKEKGQNRGNISGKKKKLYLTWKRMH